MNRYYSQQAQAGNILIYLLGAVFLMGMLVMVMKGSFTPGTQINEEQLQIRISEIHNYTNQLERGVNYILANGASEADIRFAHPDAHTDYGTITNTPSQQVFHKSGGGVAYLPPPQGIQTTDTDWLFTASNAIPAMGSSLSDLIAILPNVTPAFCRRINELNDIDNPSDLPPQDPDDFDVITRFSGDYTISETMGSNAINGFKTEGCLQGSGTPDAGSYYYYRVLLVR